MVKGDERRPVLKPDYLVRRQGDPLPSHSTTMRYHDMRTSIRVLLLFLIGIGTNSSAAWAESLPSGPPPAFAPCASCHSTQPGKTLFGPSLAGIAGRKAGALPSYAYSAAMKSAKFSWNAALLDRWLKDPRKLVPGTRMPFAGIQDPTARKSVVDFLMSAR